MAFPHYKQPDAMDCGPTCLRMVAAFYGKRFKLDTLRERSYISREGVSMLGIAQAAESIGFRTMGVKLTPDQLTGEAPLPVIIHWLQDHFVVLYKITGRKGKEIFHIADPGSGLVRFNREEFLRCWASTAEKGEVKGVALLLEPGPEFFAAEDEESDRTKFSFLFSYLTPYRKLIIQLFLGLILGSLLQLVFPFLTQSIVDQGIGNQNLSFIYLVLIAQLVLTISRASVDFIRNWILLHIGVRVNISLISDFLAKLMRLPMKFFDTKLTGDLMQRIVDHRRIESFLTGTTLKILFSMVNLVIFGLVLLYYNLLIFAVFLFGSLLYGLWVYIFLRRRAELDHRRFAQMSAHQSNLIQLIQGMQEIKLQNCEQQKRWEWEAIQAKLFRIGIRGLALRQYQQSGALVLNEIKNILITVIAAKAVVDGSMTLGMMLAVQYIIGQLNSPIEQLISFFNTTQDARISLERMGEIHERQDEEDPAKEKYREVTGESGIDVSELTFQYEGPESELVLNNISLSIPPGKQTAIVGTSGSGKTTLIKLLLGFYPPVKGEINLGSGNLNMYSLRQWRRQCGVVMQDGYLFSDTIANNIAPGVEIIDKQKLLESVKIANIDSFIERLPLGFNTRIGSEGHGLSQGQKQRLLIARAVYKDPAYIFFDEATNALDANNEKVIMKNLQEFFRGRTVIVVAHRLSTVKSADQIIVLENGEIAESGTHEELTGKRGAYYTLVKNQLEL
ncbi:MAG: peptidase domain-containing ABC transporter [Bacteroidales bacterium]